MDSASPRGASPVAFHMHMHLIIRVERDSSEWVIWEKEFTDFWGEIPKETLTVPFKDVFEINGIGDPLTGNERLCESPDADVHGPGSRLGSKPGEVDGFLCEHVALPALAFVGGEPETPS